MIICPKLGDHNIKLEDCLLSYMDSTFEIHMTSTDLQMSWTNCKKVIAEVGRVCIPEEVIIHMPFSFHTFEVYMASRVCYDKLIKMLIDCIRYSDRTGIKLGILFHFDTEIEVFENEQGIEFLTYLLSLLEDTNVYFLCENIIPDVNRYDPNYIASFELLKRIKHNKLLGCLDICHLRASENLLNTDIEIPREIIHRIHEIHFSSTTDNDGYLNKKKTHGRVHRTFKDLERDLIWIAELGRLGLNLSDLAVIVEVSEDDYTEMPDMRREMDMLNLAFGGLRDKKILTWGVLDATAKQI